ncbi:MAG: GNAT family N-acetyltransferase [Anaerolineales bacterium]|nr:GNAT family N-acetyltransferase [Anaerolineales bacterium]
MAIKILRVNKDNESQLVDYCAEHGAEHDSSYLPGRDFDFSKEHPSYLLMENKEVVGAIGLMRTKRFLSVNKGRFSIFHSILKTGDAYNQLLEAIRQHIQDLQSVYLFIPEEKDKTAMILTDLGFEIERYSFILEYSDPPLMDPVFTEGISVHPLDSADQEGIRQFVDCLNQEFKDLAGHTTNTVEDIQTWFEDQSYLEGGLCLLKKDQEPIGTIGLMRDLDDSAAGEILAVGILEKYRGLNLGRNLLRYGINFLVKNGFNPLVLSVNGENHGAIKLYESEGFQLTESVVCYSLAEE